MRNRAHILSVIFLGWLVVSGRAVDPAPIPGEAKQAVTIINEDHKPTKVPWTPDLTLMTAVIQIDPAPWRMPSSIYLTRGKERVRYNPYQLHHHPELDPKLQPGDAIEVPPIFF